MGGRPTAFSVGQATAPERTEHADQNTKSPATRGSARSAHLRQAPDERSSSTSPPSTPSRVTGDDHRHRLSCSIAYDSGVGSLGQLTTTDAIDRVLSDGTTGLHDVLEAMRAAHDAAWSATTPKLLELCRVRIAMMLGSASEMAARTPDSGVEDELLRALAAWPTDPRFDPLERACLAFTEHFVMDVASLDDDTVAAVRAHLGDDGTQTFVSALLVVEQRIRLRLAWDVLMDER
jgi:alkylhydroperoxidase family enzyme